LKKVIVTAKTVEAAIEEALRQLNTSRDKIRVTVLEEPSRGFFGLFGVRPAKVEAELVTTPVDDAVQFLENVLATMGVSATVEARTDSRPVVIDIRGDDLGMVIGRHGQTLNALQYLVNIVANRHHSGFTRFQLDAQGYRKRREESLQHLADRIAKQVLKSGKAVALEPMTPMERKVIHTHIQKYDRLTTYSEGEEPRRRVVVALVAKA